MGQRVTRKFACLAAGLISLILSAGFLAFGFLYIPKAVELNLGKPADTLGACQRLMKTWQLYGKVEALTRPTDPLGSVTRFTVTQGEPASVVAEHLFDLGLVRDGAAFKNLMAYRGMDTTIQAGEYELSPAMDALEIAYLLQDASPEEVRFVILAGWRLEEIAAALPTSGLHSSPDEFLSAARAGLPVGINDRIPSGSLEGYLLPDQYTLPRDASTTNLLGIFTSNFSVKVEQGITDRFLLQGLTLEQGITIASLVQREAVVPDERAMIASVFLNRIKAGMRLESDPTVQYAIGWFNEGMSWWKVPLSSADMAVNSPYNTYVTDGLPPGPICNPGLSAIRSVAFPADAPYLFFRAACDESGRHEFSRTYEEHLQKGCP